MSKPFLTSAIAIIASMGVVFTPLAPAWAVTNSWGAWSEVPREIIFAGPDAINATWTIVGDNGLSVNASDDRFFDASTPIGSVLGSKSSAFESSNNYLHVGGDSSTVLTVTFGAAVPAGSLGFAISDVDDDLVHITAFDSSNNPLSGAQIIGTASSAAFNYCATAIIRPSRCGPADTADIKPTISVNSNDVTVTRSPDDSEDGGTVWFRPNVTVSKVVFTQTDGIVDYWFAESFGGGAVTPNNGGSGSGSSSGTNSATLANTGAELFPYLLAGLFLTFAGISIYSGSVAARRKQR